MRKRQAMIGYENAKYIKYILIILVLHINFLILVKIAFIPDHELLESSYSVIFV